jgi:DNA-binding LacI/PurR family transcriptional regulator
VVTLRDIAKAAGVSNTTVSWALKDDERISADVRARVKQIAAEMGYRPNLYARVLRGGKTNVVTLVMPRTARPAEHIRIVNLIQGLAGLGKEVLVTQVDRPTRAEPVLRKVTRFGPEVVVFVHAAYSPALMTEICTSLHERGTPAVLTEYPYALSDDAPCDTAALDRAHAAYIAVRHLVERGHRGIGLVAHTHSPQCLQGFRAALEEAGLPGDAVELVGDETDAASDGAPIAAEAVARLLGNHPQTTALFCESDLIAGAPSYGVTALGLRIPEDIAFIQFDDDPLGGHGPLSLTTVSVETPRVGEAARELVRLRLEGSDRPWQRVLVAPTLSIRASSGAPPRTQPREVVSRSGALRT